MIDILDFSDLVHRSARGLRLLGMLRAYFDETGSDGDKEGVFGIVGLIAPTSVWRRTQIEWEHALGCFGVSEFHAVDVENCRKEFDGWTSQQREKLVGALVGIMQRRIEDFALIGSALRLEGFIRRKLEMGSGTNPYTLCATWAMIDVIDKASAKWMGERVALTFAEKAKTSKSLMDAYATAKASHENGRLLISITRARPKDVSPLQAADLFAYEANKHVNGQHDRPPRWPVAQMKPLFVGGALFDYHKLSLVMA